MAKGNVKSVTKVNHFLGFESSCIISDELFGASKSKNDVVLKELNDDRVCGLSRRDGFYPFSKLISGCKNTFMLG